MARISAVKRRNAWRRAIRQVGVLFVAIGLGNFAFTIFRGKFEFLQALFLAIFLNVGGILAINYSIETEEEEMGEETDDRDLEDNVEPQDEMVETESRGSQWWKLRDDGAVAEFRSRRPVTKVREILVHLAHPRRDPSSRH